MLLNIMASMVQSTICSAVQSAGPFSLLADECKDISKKEQISVVLRYVDANSGSVHQPLRLPVCQLKAYQNILILDTLRKHHLNPMQIVSQGYDGASVMSGRCSGVQQRIREVAPRARYVHCYAHNLNLVLVDCIRNNHHASQFFALIQAIYVFISTTKAHTVFEQKQKQLHPDKQPQQLQRLTDTHWTCHYRAINAICRTFDSSLPTLEDIANGSDHSKAVQARGLLHQIDFKFSYYF